MLSTMFYAESLLFSLTISQAVSISQSFVTRSWEALIVFSRALFMIGCSVLFCLVWPLGMVDPCLVTARHRSSKDILLFTPRWALLPMWHYLMITISHRADWRGRRVWSIIPESLVLVCANALALSALTIFGSYEKNSTSAFTIQTVSMMHSLT